MDTKSYCLSAAQALLNLSLFYHLDPYIYPHTDSMNKISINFYMKTHDAVTSFYNVKRGFSLLSLGSKIEGQTDGRVFEEDSLFKINEFTAKDGDVWILNTKRVHSVRMPGTLFYNTVRSCQYWLRKLLFSSLFYM